ncbi:hypothetical protein BSA16_28780 [Micromonospora sp. Rc5]|nr:hypothetical protein BSA16_28780 [Micromonospora sp. Rc5]
MARCLSGGMAATNEFLDGALVEELDWACHALTALAEFRLDRQEPQDVDEGILREISLARHQLPREWEGRCLGTWRAI